MVHTYTSKIVLASLNLFFLYKSSFKDSSTSFASFLSSACERKALLLKSTMSNQPHYTADGKLLGLFQFIVLTFWCTTLHRSLFI